MEVGRMSARSVTGCIQTPPYHPGGTYPQGTPGLLTEEIITSKADTSSFAITLWQTQEVPYSGMCQYVLYAITVYISIPLSQQLMPRTPSLGKDMRRASNAAGRTVLCSSQVQNFWLTLTY